MPRLPENCQRAAYICPDDCSPWSAKTGPWRAVGVRKQRLVFRLPPGSAGEPPTADGGWNESSWDPANDSSILQGGGRPAESAGGPKPSGRDGGLTVSVECGSDGGFVVELPGGRRYEVQEAAVDSETGEVSAIIDSRRYVVDAMVEGCEVVGGQGEVTLWSRHGPVEGDHVQECQRSEEKRWATESRMCF